MLKSAAAAVERGKTSALIVVVVVMVTTWCLMSTTSNAHMMLPVVNHQMSSAGCCKEGFKLIMDVILCDVPCCPGLREHVTEGAPHLGTVITCQTERRSSYRRAMSGNRHSVLLPFRKRRQAETSLVRPIGDVKK